VSGNRRLTLVIIACILGAPIALVAPGADAQVAPGFTAPESGSPLRLVQIEDNNSTPNTASDILLYSSIGLGTLSGVGLSILAHTRGTDDYAGSAVADVLLAAGVNYLITVTLKRTVDRARPYTYSSNYPSNGDIVYSQHDQDYAFHSFPSGHTSITAVFLFSVATSAYYHLPEFRGRTTTLALLYGGALAATIVVGEMRVRAGRHFYSDVIAGGLIGTTTGIAIPILNHYLTDYLGGTVSKPDSGQVIAQILPSAGPDHMSLSISGQF